MENGIMRTLLLVCSLIGATAQAQTTWDYTSAPMMGTYTNDTGVHPTPLGIAAEFTVQGTTLLSYSVSAGLFSASSPLDMFSGSNGSYVLGQGGSLTMTEGANGVVNGAVIDWNAMFNRTTIEFSAGSVGGDSIHEVFGTTSGQCSPICAFDGSNSTQGTWNVKAPEIDPAAAASGLTLLLGGLAVMRGRRKTGILTA